MNTALSTFLRCLPSIVLLASPVCLDVSAQVTNTSGFDEVFHFDLGEYWCENHLATADFDRDGWMDIVVMATALRSSNGPPWSYKCRAILLRNEGDGTFTDSILAEYDTNSNYGYFAAAVDVNCDGAPDLVLRESFVSHVLLNDGTGRSFREVSTFQPGYYGLAVGDVNRDGFPDLVSGTQTSFGGLIELFANAGTGTNFIHRWQSRLYGVAYDSIASVVIGNLNGDDWPDLAAREIYSGLLVTLHGTNSGSSFVERNVVPLGERTFALAGGNVNGDSLTDLAVYVGWGRVRVFVTQGGGSLTEFWQSPPLGQAAFNLALADFDRDGFDDVFVGTFGDGTLRIYRNNHGSGFDPWWQGNVPGEGYTGTAADLNGDGYPDLIAGEMHGIRMLVNRAGIPIIRELSMTRGLPTLTWTACPGRNYRVQYKVRLEETDWTDLSGDVTATGFTASKADTSFMLSSQRFYRVIKLHEE
jgi:hypothetical protein